MNTYDYETLTLLHSQGPKLYGVLALLSAIGLNWNENCFMMTIYKKKCQMQWEKIFYEYMQ